MSPSAAEAFGMPSPEEQSRPRTKKPGLQKIEPGSPEDVGYFEDANDDLEHDNEEEPEDVTEFAVEIEDDAHGPEKTAHQETEHERELREAEEELRYDTTVDQHISAAALANATAQIAKETFATMHAPYEEAWELLAQLRSFEIELDEALEAAIDRPNIQRNLPRAEEERRAITLAHKNVQDVLEEIRRKVESSTPVDEEEATEEAHKRAIAKEMEPVSDRELEKIVERAFAPYMPREDVTDEELVDDIPGNVEKISYTPEAKPIPTVPASEELLSIPADIEATRVKHEHITDYVNDIHARLERNPTSADRKAFDRNLVHLEVMYSELNERLRMLDRQHQNAETLQEKEILFEAMRMIEDARHRIKAYEFPEPEKPEQEMAPIPLTRRKPSRPTKAANGEQPTMHRYGGHWEDFVSGLKSVVNTFRWSGKKQKQRLQKEVVKTTERQELEEADQAALKAVRSGKKMMEVIELQSEPGDLTFLPRDYVLAVGELQQALSAKKKVKKHIKAAMDIVVSMNDELAEHPNQIFVEPAIELVEKARWELKKPPKPTKKKPKKS